jgi:toxin YhaV
MTPSKGRSHSDDGRLGDDKPAPKQLDSGAGFELTAGSWTLLFHPLFVEQLERLIAAAANEIARRNEGEPEGANSKLAFHLRRLVLQEIPEDPSRPRYRHGGALGEHLKHWLRAKFGNGRFRLFFRYRQDVRLIVFAWVNDAETLRTYGSKTDAYAVFQRMLGNGNPPDEWDALVRAASHPDTGRRARDLFTEPQDLRGSMRAMSTDLEREDDRL